MSLKKTSEIVAIGFDLTESAANTFTQSQVSLQLSPLDNEVFVCVAVDLDPSPPDNVTGTNTAVEMSLSSTSLSDVGNLNRSQVIANTKIQIESEAGALPGVGIGFTRTSLDTPQGDLGYVAIIATNDFFVQLKGRNNGAAKAGFGRLWGYRARASADTFSALVQGEVLSS
uniref:Uncharacterized protein n=1 Tax=uncultured prokaryote TaxID=198431 RepID=A0A0H5QP27_9ZZZZ|nr:hypothetical protein [uncultured prokaryote]